MTLTHATLKDAKPKVCTMFLLRNQKIIKKNTTDDEIAQNTI